MTADVGFAFKTADAGKSTIGTGGVNKVSGGTNFRADRHPAEPYAPIQTIDVYPPPQISY
jgi:hypothetical protein